jgi:hypothetical protein
VLLCIEGVNPTPIDLGLVSLPKDFALSIMVVGVDLGNSKCVSLEQS